MTTPHSLIVGGTRGIGRALTRLLAADGHSLSVVGRRAPKPVEPALAKVRYIEADLRQPTGVLATVRESIRTQGLLTGIVFLQRFRGEGDSWEGEIQTTLSATRLLIDNLVAEFSAEGGAIVMVSSNAAKFVARNQPLSYHVAKAGLNQLMRYYATVLGKKSIRVNAVSPCTVLKEESQRFYLENEKLQEMYRTITPLGRMGTATEVAQVIAFLLGPESSFVTGQELYVDGGMSLLLHDVMAREVSRLGERSGERCL
jgi:NAD(P)-dependent dehydrogenase (short-subunit alcohol dehydrogenase family)